MNKDNSANDRAVLEFIPQTYGCFVKVGGGSTTIVGGGEAADTAKNNYSLDAEDLLLVADHDVLIYSNLNTGWSSKILNAKFSSSGTNSMVTILPIQDNTYDLGSSSYRWREVHATRFIGDYSFVGLTDLAITYDIARYAAITKSNCLAHQSITSVEYYDFSSSTWTSWNVDATSLIDNDPTWGGLTIDYDHRKFRITINGGFGWAVISHFLIYFEYDGTGSYDFTVTIERSSDGSTWTQIASGSGKTSSNITIIPLGSNLGGDSYLRFTFDISLPDSTKKAVLREIIAFNVRFGAHTTPDLKIYHDRTIGFYNNIKPESDASYTLGTSSSRWKTLYIATGKGGSVAGIFVNDYGTHVISAPSGLDRLEFYRETDGRWGFYNRSQGKWLWFVKQDGVCMVNELRSNLGNLPQAKLTTAGNVEVHPSEADSSNTIRSSPVFRLYAKYWNGSSSVSRYFDIQHVMLDTSGNCKLSIKLDNTEKLYIDSNGNLSTTGYLNGSSLRIGGTEVITSNRSINNIKVITIQNPGSDTYFDILSGDDSGWASQIRFKKSDGTIRHLIVDDYNDNMLHLVPGYNGNATSTVKIDGNLTVSGNVTATQFNGSIDWSNVTNKKVVVQNAGNTSDSKVTSTSATMVQEYSVQPGYIEGIHLVANNPSGSGCTLYLQLRAYLENGSEVALHDWVSVGEGGSFDDWLRWIYEKINDGLAISSIRLYAYVSATPNSGYEPTARIDRVTGVRLT